MSNIRQRDTIALPCLTTIWVLLSGVYVCGFLFFAQTVALQRVYLSIDVKDGRMSQEEYAQRDGFYEFVQQIFIYGWIPLAIFGLILGISYIVSNIRTSSKQ
jgi:hypothetical protein